MQYLTPYELSKIMNDDENRIAEQGLSAPSGVPGGWYSRGYLPHYNNTGTIQSVTFRLADALPQSKLREIEAELVNMPTNKMDVQLRRKIEEWLDSGLGCCALHHPALAQVMQETLLKWNGDRYRLFAWCIILNRKIETTDLTGM